MLVSLESLYSLLPGISLPPILSFAARLQYADQILTVVRLGYLCMTSCLGSHFSLESQAKSQCSYESQLNYILLLLAVSALYLKNIKNEKRSRNGTAALAEKVMKQCIEMWHDAQRFTFTLRYNSKGSVASLRARPIPFYCFLYTCITVHATLSIHTHIHYRRKWY